MNTQEQLRPGAVIYGDTVSPVQVAEAEAASLREQRDELLAALEMVMRRGRIDDSEESMNQVAAAIAKAKGGGQ